MHKLAVAVAMAVAAACTQHAQDQHMRTATVRAPKGLKAVGYVE